MKVNKVTKRIAVLGVLGMGLLGCSMAKAWQIGPDLNTRPSDPLANIPQPGSIQTYQVFDPVAGQWRWGYYYTGLDGLPHGANPNPGGGMNVYAPNPNTRTRGLQPQQTRGGGRFFHRANPNARTGGPQPRWNEYGKFQSHPGYNTKNKSTGRYTSPGPKDDDTASEPVSVGGAY